VSIDASARPLEGVLVVALEQAVAGPMATCRLADAGARVIKVERPEGDFARGYDRAGGGISSYFAWANRGKESIGLDLKDPADAAVLAAMVARADVFVQNLAVGATDRLGFGAAALRARHPGLIVCDISGYGAHGPYAEMKAYDLLVQAESGLVSVSGPPGPYGRVGVSVVDVATGVTAALAITEALVRKFRSGEGAHLQASLFATMSEWMTVPLLHHDYGGAAPARVGLAHPSIAPYGGFDTADGQTLLIAVQSDREWVDLCCGVLDRPDLATDPAYATNAARVAGRASTDAAVAAVFARSTRADLEARLRIARIAYGAVNDVAALSEHPQLRRIEVRHESGTVRLPAPPVRADWSYPSAIPALDEHGPALRAEFTT
jgi:crotonobetainyl-CoA:carnitine CoA-transferase CaiB-like acyl-CoA transferase